MMNTSTYNTDRNLVTCLRATRRLREIGPEFFTGQEPVISCAVSSATARRDGHFAFEPDSQRMPPNAAGHMGNLVEYKAAKARLETFTTP